jgi:hypothetical protein
MVKNRGDLPLPLYFFLPFSLSLSPPLLQNVRKSSSQLLVLRILRFLHRREGQNTYALKIYTW